MGDTPIVKGTFADPNSANGKGLGLLLKTNTFKSTLSPFDIGGAKSITGNTVNGKYSSRVNIVFTNTSTENTSSSISFIDKNGKSSFTQNYEVSLLKSPME